MKKFLLFTLMLLVGASFSYAKKVEALIPEYVIDGAGAARAGESLVKVTIYAKKKSDVTDDMLAKAAVHGVLFKGYSDQSKQGFGGNSQHPPVAGSAAAYDEHADFFVPFFQNGNHMNYVTFVDDQRGSIKSDKGYKVSAVVRVATGNLKKYLQDQKVNVVKSLNSGW